MYSCVVDFPVPLSVLNSVYFIGQVKALESQRKEAYPNIFTGLERISNPISVHASNKLDGVLIGKTRFKDIVYRGAAPITQAEKEISGYQNALKFIVEEYVSLELTEKTIKKIHQILFSHCPEGGKYRTEDIDTKIRVGAYNIKIRADKVKLIERYMLEIIDSYHNANNINPLVLIPCFILDFLLTSPFLCGNERMSRLLAIFLLLKNGFNIVKYISYEDQITKTRCNYYSFQKLEYRMTKPIPSNKSDKYPSRNKQRHQYINYEQCEFVHHFIYTIKDCYDQLNKHFIDIQGKTKAQRIETLIVDSQSLISKSEICSLLPDVSKTTIEATLAQLLKSNIIKKIGKGKSTKYMKVDNSPIIEPLEKNKKQTKFHIDRYTTLKFIEEAPPL